jgi:hypothetical protein
LSANKLDTGMVEKQKFESIKKYFLNSVSESCNLLIYKCKLSKKIIIFYSTFIFVNGMHQGANQHVTIQDVGIYKRVCSRLEPSPIMEPSKNSGLLSS